MITDIEWAIKAKIKSCVLWILVICGCGFASDLKGFPDKAKDYVRGEIGYVHGVQYWINPGATAQSIERDFRAMSEEDHINAVRLAFWACFPPGLALDWKLPDACFESAAKYNIKVNPVLPQIPGWVDGSADDPNARQAYREHIQKVVSHYRDRAALAMWTVDIEPSRSYKVNPGPATLALYRRWLASRYQSEEEFRSKNPGMGSFETAYPVNSRDKGAWNNFEGYEDWITFTAWALAQQTRFTGEAVHQIDPVHPTSCTPPDVLHNQLIENGRNMWWLADVVECPGMQMHAHWHLETADMPKDVLSAQACSVRKVYSSGRGRPTYTGEVLGGFDLGESTRFYSPKAEELVCTELCHLAEGSKGCFYWLWNPLRDGPNAGAWSIREPDGSPGEKSIMLAQFGKMVQENEALLYRIRPADTHVAIFDSMDAAIYLGRRSEYHAMSEWYVKNQYGFYKALRKVGIGCDFIDEIGITSQSINNYDCIYVPFSMTMEPNIAAALKEYVFGGGTIIVDCLTAFTPREHAPYKIEPGTGLDQVLGVRALTPEIAYDGWSDVKKLIKEQYFDRMVTAGKSSTQFEVLFDSRGKKTDMVAQKFIQPVRPVSAKVLYKDKKGRAICTVNQYGKGHAIWTGTLIGLTCRDANTPFDRYEALAGLVKPYIPANSWTLKARDNSVVCRRLADGNDNLFVLVNEGTEVAKFTLDFGRPCSPKELLRPQTPAWKKEWFSKSKISGELKPLEGGVIYCSQMTSGLK